MRYRATLSHPPPLEFRVTHQTDDDDVCVASPPDPSLVQSVQHGHGWNRYNFAKTMISFTCDWLLPCAVCRTDAALICTYKPLVTCQLNPPQMETQAGAHRTYDSFLKNVMIPSMAMMYKTHLIIISSWCDS